MDFYSTSLCSLVWLHETSPCWEFWLIWPKVVYFLVQTSDPKQLVDCWRNVRLLWPSLEYYTTVWTSIYFSKCWMHFMSWTGRMGRRGAEKRKTNRRESWLSTSRTEGIRSGWRTSGEDFSLCYGHFDEVQGLSTHLLASVCVREITS